MTPPAGRPVLTPEVLVVGGGPAGLTAAAALARVLGGGVLVLDREPDAGGIPRHSPHTGYGWRDLRRVMTGPRYARHLVTHAEDAGASVRTEAMVTGWAGDRSVEVTCPQGRLRVDAGAVVLATGARERPRPARYVPGDRPRGVYTTGQLQNVVHHRGGPHGGLGARAVVVGAELVSWSAVVTLRAAGCRTTLMVSRHPRVESSVPVTVLGRLVLRVPVATRCRVTRVIGRRALEAVEIESLDTRARRTVACDTLVFTGDWIPDHELVRTGGVALDPHTLGPMVDTALRTSRPGVFAAGNLCHPVDSADVAALDGRHVADQVVAWLRGVPEPAPAIRIQVEEPFRWVAPGLMRPADPAPPRHRLLLWTDEFVRLPRVTIRQGGRVVASRVLPWPAAPGRVFRVPWSLMHATDAAGGPVTVGLG